MGRHGLSNLNNSCNYVIFENTVILNDSVDNRPKF